LTTRTAQAPPLVYARIAGLLYLLIILFGVFTGEWVPGHGRRHAFTEASSTGNLW